ALFRSLGAVGRLAARVPAGVEDNARQRAAGLGGADLEAVAAVVHVSRDGGRRVGGGVDLAVGNLARDGLALVGPVAVAAVPLPRGIEPDKIPVEAGGRGLAVGIEQDDLEVGLLAFTQCGRVEQRLDADAWGVEADR